MHAWMFFLFLFFSSLARAGKQKGEAAFRRMGGLEAAVVVTAGGLHSCAVELGGVAKCWGKGEDGWRPTAIGLNFWLKSSK